MKSLDPTWWNAAPGELRSDYHGDRFAEDREHDREADDIECANCSHPWSFHVRWNLTTPQPCDYRPDDKMQTLCGCEQYVEKR